MLIKQNIKVGGLRRGRPHKYKKQNIGNIGGFEVYKRKHRLNIKMVVVLLLAVVALVCITGRRVEASSIADNKTLIKRYNIQTVEKADKTLYAHKNILMLVEISDKNVAEEAKKRNTTTSDLLSQVFDHGLLVTSETGNIAVDQDKFFITVLGTQVGVGRLTKDAFYFMEFNSKFIESDAQVHMLNFLSKAKVLTSSQRLQVEAAILSSQLRGL